MEEKPREQVDQADQARHIANGKMIRAAMIASQKQSGRAIPCVIQDDDGIDVLLLIRAVEAKG